MAKPLVNLYSRDIQTYTNLEPVSSPHTIAEAITFSEASPDNLALIRIDLPMPEDIAELGTALDLHPLVIEDLMHAGQRPKLERYGDVLFIVMRAAVYDDVQEDVIFSEFHILMRGNLVALMCQQHPVVAAGIAAKVSRDQLALAHGAEGVVYALIDAVVDGYSTVLRGLEIDREQIESQVFTGDSDVAERIYRLSREVIEMQHAAVPLDAVTAALRGGFGKYRIPEELQTYLQDVDDHLKRVAVRTIDLRDALNSILQVNATLVTQRQNEDMKKISGWAAILFAPTLIGAIYGMNFDEMPELHWTFGYPLAVGAMVILGAGLWFLFRWKKWM